MSWNDDHWVIRAELQDKVALDDTCGDALKPRRIVSMTYELLTLNQRVQGSSPCAPTIAP